MFDDDLDSLLVRHPPGTVQLFHRLLALIREIRPDFTCKVSTGWQTVNFHLPKRGFILASPADSMVIQGRIAIDQAVRALEKKDFIKHVGPKIFVVDPENVNDVPQTNILPPDDYKPVFSVN